MRKSNIKWLFLFISPAFIVYTTFWMVPLIANLGLSVTSWKGLSALSNAQFIGLKNFVRAFNDKMFYLSLSHNLIYGVLTLILVAVLAFILAVFLDRYVKHKTIFRTLFFLPVVLPFIVVALLWKWMLNPAFGLVNVFLESVGLSFIAKSWLGDPKIALFVLVVVGVWKATPFHMVIFLAGLQNIPVQLEEAARVDGASPLRILFSIIIPLLRPVFVIVIALGLIDGFRVFALVYGMTDGGPGKSTEVLSLYIFRTAFFDFRIGYASALSLLLFFIVMIISFVYLRSFMREEEIQY